jgi:hydrogen cyanide synthase HcnB
VWQHRPGHAAPAAPAQPDTLAIDALILATGATDRVLPFPGWTLPGISRSGRAGRAQVPGLYADRPARGVCRQRAAALSGGLAVPVAGGKVWPCWTAAPQCRLASSAGHGCAPGHGGQGCLVRGPFARWPACPCIMACDCCGPTGVTGCRAALAVGASGGTTTATPSVSAMACAAKHNWPTWPAASSTLTRWTRPGCREVDAAGRSSVRGVYLAGDGAGILGADAAEAGRCACRAGCCWKTWAAPAPAATAPGRSAEGSPALPRRPGSADAHARRLGRARPDDAGGVPLRRDHCRRAARLRARQRHARAQPPQGADAASAWAGARAACVRPAATAAGRRRRLHAGRGGRLRSQPPVKPVPVAVLGRLAQTPSAAPLDDPEAAGALDD